MLSILILTFALLFSTAQCAICSNQTCCIAQQLGNPLTGHGYLQFVPSCLSGGVNCFENTGCQLCFLPCSSCVNSDGLPICTNQGSCSIPCGPSSCCNPASETCQNNSRCVAIQPTTSACSSQACCSARQNANPMTGYGFLQFVPSCLNGGLFCVDSTGCQECFQNCSGCANTLGLPICNISSPTPSLFEKLGGIFAIAAVVNKFSDDILNNPKVGRNSPNPHLRAWSRNQTAERLPGLKWMRTLWVADVSGGPYKFVPSVKEPSSLNLQNAHAYLRITSAEFDEVATILARVLDEFHVPSDVKAQVLGAFSAHKQEVTAGVQTQG